MSTTVSFLGFWVAQINRLSLWASRSICGKVAAKATAVCVLSCVAGHAFTQVTISTAAPVGLEADFIQKTTSQFTADYFKNPLASNTYSLKLKGLNPNYNAPPPPPSTLEQALSLGATVYTYGFRDGLGYQQGVDIGIVQGFEVKCTTPIGFSTATWDTDTCYAITGAINSTLYQLSLSTPTLIPGVP